jgi:hypothetical protein
VLSFTFEDFEQDLKGFDWDSVDFGFPDGQFLAQGLSAIESAFLSECWRAEDTESAYAFIESRFAASKIKAVYDRCKAIAPRDIDFPWDIF